MEAKATSKRVAAEKRQKELLAKRKAEIEKARKEAEEEAKKEAFGRGGGGGMPGVCLI